MVIAGLISVFIGTFGCWGLGYVVRRILDGDTADFGGPMLTWVLGLLALMVVTGFFFIGVGIFEQVSR